MKTSQNTVLITGGSAGIGFEIAKQLLARNNHVIIVGRNAERLQQAAARLGNVTAIQADVADAGDVETLVAKLNQNFPQLNMVINNAAYASLNSILDSKDIFEQAGAEMHTNYLSVLRLNQKLIPLLKQQPEAAIVNVSSIVAFVPGKLTATYSGSKAALHSYTQALRIALADTGIKVFELMPPLVDTDFSAEIGGANGIPPAQVADEFLAGLENDTLEIRVGNTEQLYRLYLSSPEEALNYMNQRRS